jgi:competence ComEA-like helix-hairpin-helix protein
MSERQNEGAGSGAQDRGAIEGRVETLHRRTEEGLREQAVDSARRHAGERATAEILALEQDLERERAARSLQGLQRLLEDAEARAAGSVTVTDAKTREDADRRLRERTEQLQAQIASMEADTEARVREAVELEGGRREEGRMELEQRIHREFERELATATEAADAAQRRLDGIAEQIEAAGKRVEGAESKLAEEQVRLRREAEERLDAEMHRLQTESDERIQEALSKVVADTKAYMEREAERRLGEQEKALRAEAEERVRVTGETVRTEAERRAKEEMEALRSELERVRGSRDREIEKAEGRAQRAEAKVTAAEEARVDAEVATKAAAADWLRGQTRALEQKAEQQAERSIAGREHELGTELEEAARALKAVEHELREAESRAESAERKLGEASEDDLRRAREEREEVLESGQTEPAPGVGWLRRTVEARRTRRAERAAQRGKDAKAKKAKPRRSGPAVDVNKATFEEFRELGMSVTQATRLIAYRERLDGFDSVEDIETVPGIPKALFAEIKDQLTL